MEALQPSLNDETTEPVSRWKCYCAFHRLFVLVLLKLVMNLGLLESLILCLRLVADAPKPGFEIGQISLAIFIDVIDIVTGLVIIIGVCMRHQGIMEIYFRYSIIIFGSLTILCCVIMYSILAIMGPVWVLFFLLFLVLLMQVYLNHLVKKEVLKLRSNEQFRVMKCCQMNGTKNPVITKCCFCVPIRKGVVIFGYFNLVLSLLSFPLLIFLLVEELTGKAVHEKGHPDPLVHLSVTIAFAVVDVVMTIVLLIGAHKKKRILLQIYFYFGIVFQMVTLCLDLTYFDYREYVENTVYFFFFGLNIYLLFLVYNTLQIIQESRDVQYVSYRENELFL